MKRASWWVHTSIVLVATTVFMVFAAWQSLPWWEYAFLSDDSPVSWLSSALLGACAAVALSLTLDRSLQPAFGSALTGALVVMALDEQFMLHEWFKYGYAATASTDGAAGAFGNAPALAVCVGGLAMALWFAWRGPSRTAGRLMLAAVAVGVFSLWVDLGRPPAILMRTEEAYEVLAESLALCALLEVPRRQVHSSS
jgi:hypothetical protein